MIRGGNKNILKVYFRWLSPKVPLLRSTVGLSFEHLPPSLFTVTPRTQIFYPEMYHHSASPLYCIGLRHKPKFLFEGQIYQTVLSDRFSVTISCDFSLKTVLLLLGSSSSFIRGPAAPTSDTVQNVQLM